jgi:CO/xanthine dehydrogenase FAD-binding subunit
VIYRDIDFLRPQSIKEALEAYREYSGKGIEAAYFAGGTELVTMARDGKVSAEAFIDLKAIPETQVLERDGGRLLMGSSVTLNRLSAAFDFPLLERSIGGLADHTVRNSITLGGNLAGRLPYREAILPLLLADAEVLVAGPDSTEAQGIRRLSLRELFDKRLRLAKGEFLVAFTVPEESAGAPFSYRRWVKSSRVDYPIVTLACLARADRLLFACSGGLAYPIWGSLPFSELRGAKTEERVGAALDELGSLRRDARASAEYRRALMRQGLLEAVEKLG